VGIPVDQPFAPVNEVLLEHLEKGGPDRTGTNRVKSETGSLPITTRADLAQLAKDAFFVLVFPRPDSINKFFTAQFMPGFTILFLDPTLNHGLSRNASMVSAGHPKHIETLHSAPSDQNILKGTVKCMPQMKCAGHIRGRNDNAIRLAGGIRVRMKKLIFLPISQAILLCLLGVVLLGQFARHLKIPYFSMTLKKVG